MFVLIGSIINSTYAAEQYVFVGKWGSAGVDDAQFDQPENVGLGTSNTIYVADTNNHRIQKFDTDGNFITKWGSGEGQFSQPFGIAIDSSNNVYVDDLTSRIQKFTSDGKFITEWGSQGIGDGQFRNPHGIAIDSYRITNITAVIVVSILAVALATSSPIFSTGSFAAKYRCN